MEMPSFARSPAAAVRLSCSRIKSGTMASLPDHRRHTLSEPARSTKWNLDTTVVHSPGPSSSGVPGRPFWPSELPGRPPPRPIAVAKLGVCGRPKVGELTRLLVPMDTEPGRAIRDTLGGDRGVERPPELPPLALPAPECLRWMRVKEKMACERDDWAFMSVSLVRRSEEPERMRLQGHVG